MVLPRLFSQQHSLPEEKQLVLFRSEREDIPEQLMTWWSGRIKEWKH